MESGFTTRRGTADDAESSTSAGPSLRQREILDAYLARPNASAVARALRTNERHVRRLVHQFADHLKNERAARDAERLERESARRSKIEDWLDATLEADLHRLDELTQSANEGVALRALKAKLDLAAVTRFTAGRPEGTFERPLLELERTLSDRIVNLDDAEEGS